MTEQPARISCFMLMRVSSFLLSAPTEQEVRETDGMGTWFRVAACLFDPLEGLWLRGFFVSDIEMLQSFLFVVVLLLVAMHA